MSLIEEISEITRSEVKLTNEADIQQYYNMLQSNTIVVSIDWASEAITSIESAKLEGVDKVQELLLSANAKSFIDNKLLLKFLNNNSDELISKFTKSDINNEYLSEFSTKELDVGPIAESDYDLLIEQYILHDVTSEFSTKFGIYAFVKDIVELHGSAGNWPNINVVIEAPLYQAMLALDELGWVDTADCIDDLSSDLIEQIQSDYDSYKSRVN